MKKKELSIIFLIFFFPLILLIHEGIFFFLSIFVILYLFEINIENKKNIRYKLGNQLKAKYVPEIRFELDDSLKRYDHINKLLKQWIV